MNERWSDEQLTVLKALHAEDKSFSTIGRAIGKSRNAVAGKLYRLKAEKKSGELAA